jgi:taurine dioxygenase
MKSALKFDNLTPHMGSEVADINLATASDAQLAAIRDLLHERLVLVFRDQKLTREQHKRVARIFGTGKLHTHALAHMDSKDDEEIFVVKADADSKIVAGEDWHTDVSCDRDPIIASTLYITETPADSGGDTSFTNMYGMLEALAPPLREMLAKVSAVHDGAKVYTEFYGIPPKAGQTYNRTVHPVILKHPVTGRELLWVNGAFTSKLVGFPYHQGRQILQMLFDHISNTTEWQCRVNWKRAGTVVIWDNLATHHRASWDYFPQRRYGERVSTVGPDLTKAAA